MYSNMSPEDINRFSMAIEERVYMLDVSYMEAIITYCEETNIDLEVAGKLVSGVLKSKLQVEAEDLHFLRRSTSNQLPL